MSLLHGEGEKALRRLQEEIIKLSDEQSLFAWTDPTEAVDHYYRLLASLPAHLVDSGNIVPYSGKAPTPILTSQRWPPARRLYTFMISKGISRLAGALLLEHVDDERPVTLLGSTTDFGVGFEVVSMSDIDNLEELQETFRPQAPGTLMVL